MHVFLISVQDTSKSDFHPLYKKSVFDMHVYHLS